MTFDWDPEKNDENFARRGFDFAFAALVFASTYVEFDDTRRDYGEQRVIALGVADGIPLTIVFTDRVGDERAIVRRIISARLSNRKERRRHAEAIEASQPQSDPDPGSRQSRALASRVRRRNCADIARRVACDSR